MDFVEAEGFCIGAGARLCTVDELVSGCNAGCSDGIEIWGVLPFPSPSPPPLQPGAVTVDAPAKEITLVLKVGGTVEEFSAVADSVEASLRQELQCSLPACLLTVTATAGSVILTVVVTDTTPGGASEVESAAVALQTKPLDAMSSVLGVTIEEAPNAPSVANVRAKVMRLAPSPPPPSPPPPSPPPPSPPP
eukprot:scaffold62351_cov60-Phaeocystis_antarctica.AAC.1